MMILTPSAAYGAHHDLAGITSHSSQWAEPCVTVRLKLESWAGGPSGPSRTDKPAQNGYSEEPLPVSDQIPNPSDGCKPWVWVATVVGYHDNTDKVKIRTAVASGKSAGEVEGMCFVAWRRDFPEATQMPTVHVSGPFYKAIS